LQANAAKRMSRPASFRTDHNHYFFSFHGKKADCPDSSHWISGSSVRLA
jgi:hypothetical protein